VKAVRNAPPEVEVVEVDDPTGTGELVRVAAAGICASDLMYLEYGSRAIAGHEFSGIGPDGTAVAVEAIFGCGSCSECAERNFNRCQGGGLTALGMLQDGGMSEYFEAPPHALIEIPAGLDVRDACLVEPAAVAWHGCHSGGIDSSTRVAIVGGGAIGILAAASARAMGAPDVAVEARHPHQHRAREVIGATVPVGNYDVVVETAGSESGLHRAVDLVRPGGTVVYIGIYGNIAWPHAQAFMKEAALRPSLGYATHHGRREFSVAAEMLASRPELAACLITHRFPLEDAAEAFRIAKDRSQGVFRVVIEP
jgi:2-desacetyl-2-hydroxyethyl bacteriochlorophyllide A dehydrogenase